MITETATVVKVKGDQVTLEAQIKTSCNACQQQDDCGTGVVAKAMAPKSQQLVLATPLPLQQGDLVKVGIPEESVVTASAWLYLAPLVLFIGAFSGLNAILQQLPFYHELLVLAGALVVSGVGFLAISRYLKRLDIRRFQPVILSKL